MLLLGLNIRSLSQGKRQNQTQDKKNANTGVNRKCKQEGMPHQNNGRCRGKPQQNRQGNQANRHVAPLFDPVHQMAQVCHRA